jgi:hypothetical protein
MWRADNPPQINPLRAVEYLLGILLGCSQELAEHPCVHLSTLLGCQHPPHSVSLLERDQRLPRSQVPILRSEAARFRSAYTSHQIHTYCATYNIAACTTANLHFGLTEAQQGGSGDRDAPACLPTSCSGERTGGSRSEWADRTLMAIW